MSEQLNISIMAQAETDVAVESGPAPSLAESYAAHNDDTTGEKESRKRQRSERSATVAQEEDSAREIGESSQRSEHAKPRREQTLQEALNSSQPETAEEFTLPSEFAGYDPADIEACLGMMGFSESDLQRPELAALVLKEMEDSFPQNADEGAGEEDGAKEEAETKKPEEEKPEEKKLAQPLPSTLAELTPEQRVEMDKHVEQVWERTQKNNSGPYHENFVKSLAGILETPAENMATLDKTIQALEWGAQSIVETAVPAVVTEYLQQNVVAILRQVLPHVFPEAIENYMPGSFEDYSERTLTSVWDGVRGDLPEFSMEAGSEFQELAKALPPQLASWEPKAADGKPLPMRAALTAKAEVIAKLMRGEKAGPNAMRDAVAKALETGKRSAEKSNRRVSAVRTLGAGRTTGSMGKQESAPTSLRDAYNAQHKNEGIA